MPIRWPVKKNAGAAVDRWNETDRRVARGERLFWTQQPRVGGHLRRKALIDGMPWQVWLPHFLGRPAEMAAELGCDRGARLASLLRVPAARKAVGIDTDETRFEAAAELLGEAAKRARFVAVDINQIRLEERSYELIYAHQAFHHFENLEHIFAEIDRALRPGGLCILNEYVGPARFQWTDEQLGLTSQILGVIPRHLRIYQNGVEKLTEGRSSVEDVIRVCPREAIRSNEIAPLFYETFDVLHHKKLGGTIQQLVYSGIVQNFPDDDPATDRIVDSIDGLESVFIEHGILPSDFALLVGRKR